jgi:peroxiredoxin
LKNKSLKYLFVNLLLTGLTSMLTAFTACAQVDTSNQQGIPPFAIISIIDSSSHSLTALAAGKPVLLVVFNTECELCNYEINEIRDNIRLFNKYRIILASPQDFKVLRLFYQQMGLHKFPGIFMGNDPGYQLGRHFNIRAFPSMFVYNSGGQLVRKFNGSETIQEIAGAL